ncbi:MAG: selenium cofactor biosynthesis protein YqeC [Tissierellia bacterium]|nr:selenium cofactor biosynthesis protein YqeC [Tissierellia bacterium]
MKKPITDILNTKENKIISITGAGGKTTLMMDLAKKLQGKVLITTSTKIKTPKEGIHHLYIEEKGFQGPQEGITAIGNEIYPGKLGAISPEFLEKWGDEFDHIIIEADGCRNLPLKMWKKNEPVIYPKSDIVIGVFSIKVLGEQPSPKIMYYHEGLTQKFDIVNGEMFRYLIKNGLFRHFFNGRYVFINQTDNQEEREKARELIEEMKREIPEIHYFYGSAKEGIYHED